MASGTDLVSVYETLTLTLRELGGAFPPLARCFLPRTDTCRGAFVRDAGPVMRRRLMSTAGAPASETSELRVVGWCVRRFPPVLGHLVIRPVMQVLDAHLGCQHGDEAAQPERDSDYDEQQSGIGCQRLRGQCRIARADDREELKCSDVAGGLRWNTADSQDDQHDDRLAECQIQSEAAGQGVDGARPCSPR